LVRIRYMFIVGQSIHYCSPEGEYLKGVVSDVVKDFILIQFTAFEKLQVFQLNNGTYINSEGILVILESEPLEFIKKGDIIELLNGSRTIVTSVYLVEGRMKAGFTYFDASSDRVRTGDLFFEDFKLVKRASDNPDKDSNAVQQWLRI